MSAFPDTPVTLLARMAAERTGASEASWTRFFELYQPVIVKFAAFRVPDETQMTSPRMCSSS